MDFLEEATFREAWLFMHRPYDINEQAQPNTENELWFKMLAAPLEGVNIFIADDRHDPMWAFIVFDSSASHVFLTFIR